MGKKRFKNLLIPQLFVFVCLSVCGTLPIILTTVLFVLPHLRDTSETSKQSKVQRKYMESVNGRISGVSSLVSVVQTAHAEMHLFPLCVCGCGGVNVHVCAPCTRIACSWLCAKSHSGNAGWHGGVALSAPMEAADLGMTFSPAWGHACLNNQSPCCVPLALPDASSLSSTPSTNVIIYPRNRFIKLLFVFRWLIIRFRRIDVEIYGKSLRRDALGHVASYLFKLK